MAMKQLESLSPPIMKQVLPLVEQLPPLYMDLVKGREDFIPKPEETRRLVCYNNNNNNTKYHSILLHDILNTK
jgi:hypothetical protein